MKGRHAGVERVVRVHPGDHYVSEGGAEEIVTVLGSCVAACIRDPYADVGGMNHFMLPESDSGAWGVASASLRFGNFAMERLINDILCRGGRRQNLDVKVFGGASMFGLGLRIGSRNAEFVEAYLGGEGIAIAAADLRGARARRVHYWPRTGRVRLLTLPDDTPGISDMELRYASSVPTEPACGSIELFD